MEPKDPLILESEFYSKKFYFSYSGMNMLLYSPNLFYKHYILRKREEKLDLHLVEGKAIHCLLLDDENFSKQFIVSPSNLPSENTQKVVNQVCGKAYFQNMIGEKLSDHEDLILQTLQEMNLHQSLKTDPQRLAKIITEETQSYWAFLLTKGNKTLLDQETLDKCKESVSIIRNNSDIYHLLEGRGLEVYNEKYIQVDLDKYTFGLHGQIDNVSLDHKNKIVYINDLKTSGKTLAEFKDSVEYYRYWLQAAIYTMLVGKSFNLTGWQVKFTFIVIDKYQQVYPFEVTTESLKAWLGQLNDIAEKVNYHYTLRKYTLPYEFMNSKITL